MDGHVPAQRSPQDEPPEPPPDGPSRPIPVGALPGAALIGGAALADPVLLGAAPAIPALLDAVLPDDLLPDDLLPAPLPLDVVLTDVVLSEDLLPDDPLPDTLLPDTLLLPAEPLAATPHPGRPRPAPHPLSTVTVDLVIPVFNEERALPGCVATLHDYCTRRLPFDWTITIVDNASTDTTRHVAQDLAGHWPRVRVVSLDRRGKGNAVRTAWTGSSAGVVVYMDVDLSTGLDALVPLVAPLAVGHCDLAIGSRLAPGARTVRGARRELLSRGYNALIRLTHGTRFRDTQCGFKAARAEVVGPLLRRVRDDSWFFDTELLLLAEHNGLRVLEVPVDWVEDVDSRVDVTGTIAGNVRGLARVALAKLSGAAAVTDLPTRPAPGPTHPDAVLRDRPRSRRPWLRCPRPGARRRRALPPPGHHPATPASG
ncbi:glycosyl transferase, family 2 [Actinosynnema pretiosum subsp. pretiosum]|nr:glycosyl transferase, family 2 [Actinosynnema pretiosum subsp. pretiosum]